MIRNLVFQNHPSALLLRSSLNLIRLAQIRLRLELINSLGRGIVEVGHPPDHGRVRKRGGT